jgi:primary-amine oxidase
MVDTHYGAGGLGLTSSPSMHHPLEPLTAEELGAAVALVREKRQLGGHVRFVSVALHEPPKNIVLNFKEGDQVPR